MARLAILAVAVLALTAPWLLGTFWISLVTQMLILGLLALSVDLLTGHTGILPMGHAGFFAVAAYTTAILEVRHAQGFWVSAGGGVLVAALLAVVFGLAVRTSGVYFILLTLALGHIVWGVAMRWTTFTGGENGVSNVPPPAVAAVRFADLSVYYYLVLAVVVACGLGYHRLVRSPFGLALRGIRESESRMRGLGYNVFAHKYAAFVISGGLAGVAGVLYAYWNRFVSPAAATFHASAEAVLMGILGGTGTILGPFIGAAIILGIRNWVSGYVGWWTAVMGLVFIATVLWAPHGLLGLVREMRGRFAARQAPAPRAAALGQTPAPGTSAMTGAGRPGGSREPPATIFAASPDATAALALEVADLRKAFGGIHAVDGVSMRIPTGQRRAIIGPNGAGKTTLFACLTGALRPTAGRIALFGRDVTGVAEHRRAAMGVGRTYQITNVFPGLTVLENVLLALHGTSPRKWVMYRPVHRYREARDRALAALERIGLDGRSGVPVRLLSYGERRQLELALALVGEPRVLLLDEPAAGLAPAERVRVSEAIAAIDRRVTLVLIEHDMTIALGLADHVTVLHRGRVIIEGPPGLVQGDTQVREVYLGHA